MILAESHVFPYTCIHVVQYSMYIHEVGLIKKFRESNRKDFLTQCVLSYLFCSSMILCYHIISSSSSQSKTIHKSLTFEFTRYNCQRRSVPATEFLIGCCTTTIYRDNINYALLLRCEAKIFLQNLFDQFLIRLSRVCSFYR